MFYMYVWLLRQCIFYMYLSQANAYFFLKFLILGLKKKSPRGGTGKLAQWVKCLLHKNPTLGPRICVNAKYSGLSLSSLHTWGQNENAGVAHWMDLLQTGCWVLTGQPV